MSYIGNTPFTAAFLTDTFSGNGSTVAFTMSVAPANTSSILVAVTGVVQDPSTYSVSGTTLTFSAAPPSGTSNISVRYLGIPASGVTTTAYRTVTDSTATAGQTTFTIPSYTVGYVDVYRNGVRLAAADYTATTGTTVVLASAASAGDTITTESFYVSSVLNAIPATAYSISPAYMPAGSIVQVVTGSLGPTTNFATSSATPVATGLSATITPYFSNSKILVSVSGGTFFNAGTTGQQLLATIYRNSTNLAGGNGLALVYSPSASIQVPVSVSIADLPATTSPTTYSLYLASANTAGSVTFIVSSSQSTITLMEIRQ